MGVCINARESNATPRMMKPRMRVAHGMPFFVVKARMAGAKAIAPQGDPVC